MNEKLFRNASFDGHLDVVKKYVDMGCDPKADRDVAVKFACYNGHLDVVKYLVGKGCCPNTDDNWTLEIVNDRGHKHILKYLLELGYYSQYIVICRDRDTRINEIKYDVFQEVKLKLMIFMHTIPNNKYLKLEIIRVMLPMFSVNKYAKK